MTRHSRYEQAQRAAESERMREIGTAWMARLSADERSAFSAAVLEAQARPRPERVDMAPGTLPNPPRPGREPRPPKGEEPRRSRG